MLLLTRADIAHRYYERAVHACLADHAAYQLFINSNFGKDNSLKSVLQLPSIAYLAESFSLDQEVAKWYAGAVSLST